MKKRVGLRPCPLFFCSKKNPQDTCRSLQIAWGKRGKGRKNTLFFCTYSTPNLSRKIGKINNILIVSCVPGLTL
jgi:hypothetical protein